MDEFELIRRYFVREDEAQGVIVGIGDDGAVLRPEAGREIITVIDTLVERVHFPSDIPAADLGYRAVAVNLSDIAAMGGRPLWMTLALTMASADERWIGEFAEGLHLAAAEHGVALVGGDTTSGDAVVVSVQITGDVIQGQAILRSGAQPGDKVYVTGTFGDAAAGLELFRSGATDSELVQRYLRPSARIAVGELLGGIASAAIDVSDGLAGDLAKLLDASGVGAEIDVGSVPLSTALKDAFGSDAQRAFALSGGDDYELCFTSSHKVPDEIAGVATTPIGRITAEPGLICRDRGSIVEIDASGYRHFR